MTDPNLAAACRRNLERTKELYGALKTATVFEKAKIAEAGLARSLELSEWILERLDNLERGD